MVLWLLLVLVAVGGVVVAVVVGVEWIAVVGVAVGWSVG